MECLYSAGDWSEAAPKTYVSEELSGFTGSVDVIFQVSAWPMDDDWLLAETAYRTDSDDDSSLVDDIPDEVYLFEDELDYDDLVDTNDFADPEDPFSEDPYSEPIDDDDSNPETEYEVVSVECENGSFGVSSVPQSMLAAFSSFDALDPKPLILCSIYVDAEDYWN